MSKKEINLFKVFTSLRKNYILWTLFLRRRPTTKHTSWFFVQIKSERELFIAPSQRGVIKKLVYLDKTLSSFPPSRLGKGTFFNANFMQKWFTDTHAIISFLNISCVSEHSKSVFCVCVKQIYIFIMEKVFKVFLWLPLTLINIKNYYGTKRLAVCFP